MQFVEGGPDGKDHLFLFSVEELSDLVEKCGFDVMEAGMHSSVLYNRHTHRLAPIPKMQLLLAFDKMTSVSESLS